MKILLLGEYSNVHWTLACALRKLGHEVCVVSNGDEWKGYPADISLIRKPGRWGAITYLYKVLRLLPKLRGYDVVQLINPVHFIDLKAERGIRIYDYLRQHNKRVFLGAFGYDYYLVYDSVVRRTLRYCDFYTPTQEVHHEWNTANEHDWLHTFKKEANIHIAETCDGIISGLYEYDVAYRPHFPEKTTFIPFPIELEHTETEIRIPRRHGQKIRFFIGIQRHRTALKGTDIMLRALERIVADYPDRAEMIKAESVPFNQYKEMHRLGFAPEDIPELIARLKRQTSVIPRSVFSHLVGSDCTQFDAFTRKQIETFEKASEELQSAFPHKILRHICNTAGIERYPGAQFDMVRLGLGLYGVNPFTNQMLHNVSTLKTTILQIRDVPQEDSVGYSRKGRLYRDSRIAAIPIGYADGLNRRLGNGHAYCLVNGQKAPYVGNICMDVCMIDVTDIDCKEGDKVIIFGDELPVTVLADALDTISYEILTSVSNRVKRIYYQD